MAEIVESAGAGNESEIRRKRQMEVPPDLDSRFLRVGNKLYRSAHDREPVATITPDRIKAKDRDSLPDLIRLAKENGWTSIKVSGDAEFQRAAYLAASAQGIKVDVVYTSEDYGEGFAAHLGVVHRMVDRQRLHVPISGTLVRAAPTLHTRFLPPIVRSHLAGLTNVDRRGDIA